MIHLFKKKIRDKLPLRSEFTKNALTLTLGTSIAQVFPILFYPLLSRLFLPQEFGFLATLTSITSILTVLSTGKYENSILLAKTRKHAANIIWLVLIGSFFLLLLFYIFLQIFSNQLSTWFNEPGLKRWIFICPLSAYAIIIFNCYNEWCVLNKSFKNLAWNKITNSAATTLGKLFLGLVKIVNNGLVVGDLAGRIISAGGCIYRALKNDAAVFSKLSYNKIRYLAKRYVEFPKYTLPAQILNTVGGSAPVLFIGAYFNSMEVGYFSMTINVLSLPLSVISRAILDTFRQRANEEYVKTGNCSSIYKKLLKILVLMSGAGTLILFFALPDLFAFILGDQWRISGKYSQILLPMIAINFIYLPLSSVLIITEKMKIDFYWQIYYVGITFVSLITGCLIFNDIVICLTCFSIGMSSAYLFHILLSYKYSKGRKINER